MNRLLTASSLFICLFCCALITTHCEDPLFCTGDRDCVRKFGTDFFCNGTKCKAGSTKKPDGKKEESTVDAAPDLAPDEPSLPEQQPEPIPEPRITPPDGNKPDKGLPDTAPVVRKKLHEPCKDWHFAPETEKCGLGLICHRIDGKNAFCFQSCASNSAVCKANQDRTECRTVGWEKKDTSKAVRICTQQRKKGETCDAGQSLYCDNSTNPPLLCVEGRCEEGKLCTSSGCSCDSKPGAPVRCDVSRKLVCDLSSNTCLTGVRSVEGNPCGLKAGLLMACDPGFTCTCTPGSQCLGNSRPPNTCQKLCDLSNPVTSCSVHLPGFVCKKHLPNDDKQGVCVQSDCTTHQDCLHQSYAHICTGKANGSNVTRWCQPMLPEGQAGNGEACDSTFTTSLRCKHPFHCSFIRQETVAGRTIAKGYCNLQCDNKKQGQSTDYCNKHLPGSTCTLTQRDIGIQSCGWSCRDNAKCPDGYGCHSNICTR